MNKNKITVLGSGNTGISTAAKLSHDGFDIILAEIPEFESSILDIKENKTILLKNKSTEVKISIKDVTSDLKLSLKDADIILIAAPAYAHKNLAEKCAPYLNSDQIIVLMPGTLGSLEWAKILSENNVHNISIAETDTSPYVCRKTNKNEATIFGTVSQLGLGVFPSINTKSVYNSIKDIFPGLISYQDVIECGLSSINPVIHPAGVIMNAGRIERSKGEFYFYEEGVTPSVVSVINSLDKERISIGKSLGYELQPIEKAINQSGLGPKGNLWSSINGSEILTQLKAPITVKNRWISEDIPYGIATWSMLGNQIGIETPVMQSLTNIGSIISSDVSWEKSRNLSDLGIEKMAIDNLKKYIKTGSKQ